MNAVFIASESSAYDDKIEERYHFPKTYLRAVKAAVGDYIVYYEPRRNSGRDSTDGRQAYFAMARVVSVDSDPDLPGHYYARIADYIEFDNHVPFREGGKYYESALKKDDGSTNRGAFGRAVRTLPANEFMDIVRTGFSVYPEPWEEPVDIGLPSGVEDEHTEYVVHPTIELFVSRKFRDVAFRRHVRSAYQNTCAVTGIRLINGGGRPEVQAAHIRPVKDDGPDTVRNGIALTGTAHWLFDRGLISFDDDYRVLLSPHGLPDELDKIIRPDRKLLLPQSLSKRPHPTYLKWHRENQFKR